MKLLRMVKSLEGIISVNQETLIFGKLLIIESLSNILETKFLEYSEPSVQLKYLTCGVSKPSFKDTTSSSLLGFSNS